MSEYKPCSTCSAILPLSEYHKHPKTKDGLNPRCKSCKRLSDKTSRNKNLGQAIQNSRNFRLKNPDYQRNYLRANPDKSLLMNSKRRISKLDNGVFFIDNQELVSLYSSSCFYCGSKEKIQADHVVPLSRGGRHSIGNLVPACRSCNSSKSDKTIMEWRIWLAKL